MFIKVIDDLLDQETADNIEKNILRNNKFVWFFEPSALADVDNVNYQKTPFFVHPLFAHGRKSGEFWMADIIAEKIVGIVGDLQLSSSNTNLLPENPVLASQLAEGHVDRMYLPEVYDDFLTYTAVYYVNTTDNETLMYNEFLDDTVGVIKGPFTTRMSVPTKKNSLLIFDSRIYHSAPCASSNGYRSVINFNFMVPKESSLV